MGRRLRFSHDYCLQVNAEMRGLPPPVDDDKTQPLSEVTPQPKDSFEKTAVEEEDVSQKGDGEDEEVVKGNPEEPSFDVYQFDFTSTGQGTSNSDSVPEEDSVSSERIEDSSGGDMVLDHIE